MHEAWWRVGHWSGCAPAAGDTRISESRVVLCDLRVGSSSAVRARPSCISFTSVCGRVLSLRESGPGSVGELRSEAIVISEMRRNSPVPGLADDGEIAVVADATGVPAEAKADRLTRRDAFQSSHDKCTGQALPTRLPRRSGGGSFHNRPDRQAITLSEHPARYRQFGWRVRPRA
jgi:hypothetical protein